jgi:hypothetical protein
MFDLLGNGAMSLRGQRVILARLATYANFHYWGRMVAISGRNRWILILNEIGRYYVFVILNAQNVVRCRKTHSR